jgi:hypothetical protein
MNRGAIADIVKNDDLIKMLGGISFRERGRKRSPVGLPKDEGTGSPPTTVNGRGK